MTDKRQRPSDPDPANDLYFAVKFGDVAAVQQAIAEAPELVRDRPVVDGAWSHGGRRCTTQDEFLRCLWLLIEAGARFETCCASTIDSAFKTFPRAAALLFSHGANASIAGGDGKTILHSMAEIGNRYAAGILIEHGADIRAKTSAGETARDVAANLGLTRMDQFLRDRESEGGSSDDHRQLVPEEGPAQVNWYRADRGYGYLHDSKVFGDLFFDEENIVTASAVAIEQGVPVSFEIAHDDFGLYASEIRFVNSSVADEG